MNSTFHFPLSTFHFQLFFACAVHPRALDRSPALDRHAERGKKDDSGSKVVDDDADVVQSLDRHVPTVAETVRGGPRLYSSVAGS